MVVVVFKPCTGSNRGGYTIKAWYDGMEGQRGAFLWGLVVIAQVEAMPRHGPR